MTRVRDGRTPRTPRTRGRGRGRTIRVGIVDSRGITRETVRREAVRRRIGGLIDATDADRSVTGRASARCRTREDLGRGNTLPRESERDRETDARDAEGWDTTRALVRRR